MRVRDIHAAVEALVGELVPPPSVKGALAKQSQAPRVDSCGWREDVTSWPTCPVRMRCGNRSDRCSTFMGMTETEIITEIGRRLSVSAPAGSQVVLFGSRARGVAGDTSDYDVLVIEPAVANSAVESARLRGQLDDLRTPIDVIVVAEDVARRRAVVRGTVVERALREGRVLART